MKKTSLAIIALFLVLFTAAGVFSASATSPNGAVADLEAELTTTRPHSYIPTTTEYHPTTTVPHSYFETTTLPNYWYFCPNCGEIFDNEYALNEHVTACTGGHTNDYIDLSVKDILTMIIDLAKSETSQWDEIESAVVRLVELIENLGSGDVEGAVADLETALEDSDIKGMDTLLAMLKEKIKAMFAGEVATTAATETTTCPVATGTDTDAPTIATGTDTDCDCNCECECNCHNSLWDIIGGWFEKIAEFFRSIIEFIC